MSKKPAPVLATRKCGFRFLRVRQHLWGTWRDSQGVSHAVCCERCGLYWGHYVQAFPDMALTRERAAS